jgi:hypothetical protein
MDDNVHNCACGSTYDLPGHMQLSHGRAAQGPTNKTQLFSASSREARGISEHILGEIQTAANDFKDLHMRWNAGTRSILPTLAVPLGKPLQIAGSARGLRYRRRRNANKNNLQQI